MSIRSHPSVIPYFFKPLSSVLLWSILVCLSLLDAGCYRDIPPSADKAVQTVTDLLHDRDALVRRTAAEALGKIGRPSAERPLVNALWDSDARVREAAGRSLGQLPTLGGEAASALISRLKDSDPSVQQAAAQSLGLVEDTTLLTPLLANLLDDTQAAVRRSAAHALWLVDTSDTAVRQSLGKAAQDSDASVRQWAVAALGESGAAGMASVLLDRLRHDPAEGVQVEAAYRLRFLGDSSVLRELAASQTRDSNMDVTRWIQQTIAALKPAHGSDLGLLPTPPTAIEHSRQYP